jgi:dolichol-phosphate mannosyltransferase
MSQEPELSVVLPTLDESAGLTVLLPRLKALFEKLGVRGEILVVDGGSKDATAAIAEAHGARVVRQKGRGFGSAVREGIAEARAERVALMDADGSHAPEALEAFWTRRSDAELIVGSRYCRGGSAQMPMTRQVLSRALNLVSRRALELPVRESSSGFRLYHGPSARAVVSGATDFSVQQDLMVGILSAGGRVIELPIHYAPRVGGASKANAWKLAPAYVRLLLRLKPRRGGWRAEAGLALVLIAAAYCGFTELGGAAAAAFLAAGALCAHEIVRLRADRFSAVLLAAAWPAAALAGAPLAGAGAAFAALAVFLAAAAADSVFP